MGEKGSVEFCVQTIPDQVYNTYMDAYKVEQGHVLFEDCHFFD
jgi:hypothetical protein